jgi:hypothetical protein
MKQEVRILLPGTRIKFDDVMQMAKDMTQDNLVFFSLKELGFFF